MVKITEEDIENSKHGYICRKCRLSYTGKKYKLNGLNVCKKCYDDNTWQN